MEDVPQQDADSKLLCSPTKKKVGPSNASGVGTELARIEDGVVGNFL